MHWSYLQGLQDELSSSQFRKRCRAEYLNFLRVREWQDLHGQLRRAARDVGLQALYDELRATEAADAECRRYPRLKPRDDATAVLASLVS